MVCTVRKNAEDSSEVPKEVLRLSAGQYFGERALLTNARRAANVVACGPVTLLCLGRGQLEVAMGGPLQEVFVAEGQWKEALALQREVLARKNTSTVKLVQVCGAGACMFWAGGEGRGHARGVRLHEQEHGQSWCRGVGMAWLSVCVCMCMLG